MRSLRIKVTGKCNRKCCFCHQEGGMIDLEDISYNSSFRDFIIKCFEEFKYTNITLTGGEPLLHNDLLGFVSNISKLNLKNSYSMTTNGTITKSIDFWQNLKDLGLNKVSISMPDFLNSIEDNGLLKNQQNLIAILNSLNIKIDINVVVFHDFYYTKSVIDNLYGLQKSYNFNLYLLPNLNNYDYSKMIIDEIICGFKCKLVNYRIRSKNTSNGEFHYKTKDNKDLYVKSTKKDGKTILLSSFCQTCKLKDKCQEGFYGIRVEQIGGKAMVRACLCRADEKTLIPIESFFDSEIFKNIKSSIN